MEKNGYPAVNSEKTIFMRRVGNDFIRHGLFVDDMMHISTSTKLKEEFMTKYSKDFKITGGGLLKSFLVMQIEQGDKKIKLHLDHYVQEMLTEYKDYIKIASTQACPDVLASSSGLRIARLSLISTSRSSIGRL
jgi:hypothetical protein